MDVTSARLLRWAGLSALIAGSCYVFVGVFHPPNAVVSAATTRWEVVHVVACAMCFFGMLGLTGLYVRQAARVGWTGLVGYVLLSLWFVLVMGFSFVEAFIIPRVVTATPSLVDAWMKVFNGGTSRLDLGVLPTLWTLVGVVYILGGLLFGIATFRAHILPRGAAVLLALGTLLAPLGGTLSLAAQPKIAIPTGLALAWMGYALMTERQMPVAVSVEDRAAEATMV
jgi:hypothetical protein